MPFVFDSAIPSAHNEYVCWLDIMGTKTKMENSVKTCSIFIFKLHTAVLEAIEKGCDIQTYPVMDGVYFTSKRKKDMEKALSYIFSTLGKLFIDEKEFEHQFLVKAAVAYGPIIHGSDIGNEINRQFANNEIYKQSLLLGLPMIQAYSGESKAPPFGVFVHESARAFHPEDETPFMFKWWKWFRVPNAGWTKDQTAKLKEKTAVHNLSFWIILKRELMHTKKLQKNILITNCNFIFEPASPEAGFLMPKIQKGA